MNFTMDYNQNRCLSSTLLKKISLQSLYYKVLHYQLMGKDFKIQPKSN